MIYKKLQQDKMKLAQKLNILIVVDNPSIVIEINTKDGKNLFSKTYHATK